MRLKLADKVAMLVGAGMVLGEVLPMLLRPWPGNGIWLLVSGAGIIVCAILARHLASGWLLPLQEIAAGMVGDEPDHPGDDVAVLASRLQHALERWEREQEVWKRQMDGAQQQQILLEAELQEARQSADSSERTRIAFLNGVNHELRTPLNTVLSALQLMQDAVIDPRHREYLNLAYDSTEALLALIEDLLTVAQFESRQYSLDSVDFDLRQLVDEIALGMAGRASACGLELSALVPNQFPTAVRGDANRLRQIFQRLLDFAFRNTPPGGIVEIYGNPVDAREDVIEFLFEIRNAGLDFPVEVTHEIFEDHMRLDGAQQHRMEGISRGLGICRRLVEMMGGEIGVDRHPVLEKGQVLFFSVPLRKQLDPIVVTDDRLQLRNLRVLAVGCLGIQAVLLENAMIQWGARVSLVAELSMALEQIFFAEDGGRPFEAVILNQKPGEQVRETLGALQQSAPQARFILLTDWLDQGWDQVTELSGKTVCLKKPFSSERLALAVTQLFADYVRDDAETVAPKSMDQADPQIPPAIGAQDARILLVDDHRTNLKLAQAMLVRLGCDVKVVDCVTGGEEAIASYREHPYCLIFMDCQMPGLDGYQTTRGIRDWEREQGLPAAAIVAFTADVTPETRSVCLTSGMDDFLAKPVSLSDLQQRLHRYWPLALQVPESVREVKRKQAVAEMTGAMASIGLPQEAFVEIAQLILTQWPELMANLEKEIHSDAHEAARATAHVLKGSMANILFPQLKELTLVLHEAIRASNWKQAQTMLQKLGKEFAPVQQALETLVQGST